MKRRLDEFREIGDFLFPSSRKRLSFRFLPMRLRHHVSGKGRTLHRAHQTHAPFDVAVVGHHAARGNLNRRAPRLAVDEKKRLGCAQEFKGLVERQGLGSITLSDRQQLRARGSDGVRKDRPAVRDDKTVGL